MVADLDMRVVEIIECEKQAEQHEAIADDFRWKAAELIAAELAAGKTQRQLAAEIGKDHRHIGRMNRVWQRFGDLGPQERPAFNEAYQQAKRAEADADEDRRRTAVAYQTTLYSPAAIIAHLADGDKTAPQIAAHMRDYEQYISADRQQLRRAAEFLLALADAS